MNILSFAVPALLVVVVVILGMGLYQMTQSGDEHREKSNKLMRWRIATQAAVVVLLLLMMWLGKDSV